MKCGSFQRNVSHLCLLRKLSAKWPPAPQQPRNLCSPGAARHNFSATHSGLQRTRSHRVTAFPAAVAVSSPQAKDGLCQCHIDPTHHHSRHSSRHIKMLSSGCCSHRVLCDHVACSRGSIHNHRIRAAAAPENPESAAHNGDDSRSEQASTQAAPTAATNLPPAPSDRNGGDGGQGRDSGDGGGQGSGKGGDAGGFGQQPKFPAWYTVRTWIWFGIAESIRQCDRGMASLMKIVRNVYEL